ncbi:MAG: hypothetical protein ACKVT0_21125 [Planctomycetaceae bacterium]
MSSDPIQPPVTRFRRIKATLWIMAGFLFLIVFVIPMSVRVYRLWGIPDVGHPFDVEEFGTVELPDDENARIDYDAAIAALVPLPKVADRDTWKELDVALSEGWSSATPVIRQWLDDNRPALERWRRGTEKPDFLFVQPKTLNFSTSTETLQEYRPLDRLAALESSRLLAEGQHNEAWIWSRAILRFSRHVGQHGYLIERLTGASLYQAGVNSTLALAHDPSVTEELLRQMLQESTAIAEKTVPQSVTIKCEYLSINNTMNDPKYLLDDDTDTLERLKIRMGAYFVAEFRLVQLLSQHYVANILDQIDLPMKDRQPRIGSVEVFQRDPAKTYPPDVLPPETIEERAKKSWTFRAMMISAYRQLDYACLNELTRQRTLEICLASQIYQKMNGAYPKDLDDLVRAGILDEIPIDPYSKTGERMHYRVTADGVLAWSIGYNGIDDGGEIDKSNRKAGGLLDVGLRLGDSVEAQKP